MKKKVYLVVITALHFILTIGLMLFSFSEVMSRFDDGIPPTVKTHLFYTGMSILSFPIVSLARLGPSIYPGLLGYIPYILNSLLWAFVIVYGLAWLRSKIHKVYLAGDERTVSL